MGRFPLTGLGFILVLAPLAVLVGLAYLLTRGGGEPGGPRETLGADPIIRPGLYVFDRATLEVRLLTAGSQPFAFPADTTTDTFDWSGGSIVYGRMEGNLYTLEVADAASGARLTIAPALVWGARTLSDGRVLLHMRGIEPGSAEGYGYLNVATGQIEAFREAPAGAVSPDGRLLAFQPGPEARGYAIRDLESGAEIAFLPGDFLDASFSPDSRSLALSQSAPAAGGRATMLVWRWPAGDTVQLGEGARGVWSPDGTVLALTQRESRGGGPDAAIVSSIAVQPVDGSRPAWRLGEGRTPTWSPDGASIAFERDGALVERDILGGREVTLLRPALPLVAEPRWSPDDRYIAFRSAGTPGEILVVNADGSGERLAGRGAGPTWSPSGDRIAFTFGREYSAGSAGHVYAITADGSSTTKLGPVTYGDTIPACSAVARLSWSPDGTRLAWPSPGSSPDIMYVAKAGGGEPALVRDAVGGTWRKDGKHILYSAPSAAGDSARCAVLEATAGLSDGETLLDGVTSPLLSPDGRWLAVIRLGTPDFRANRIEVRSADGRQLVADLGAGQLLAWSPDSRYLAVRRTGASVGIALADSSDGFAVRSLDIPGMQDIAWAPDGRTFAFTRIDFEQPWIWIATVDNGVAPRRLAQGGSPSWAPDGKRLVFSRARTGV